MKTNGVIIYPKLSYQLMAILFSVHNQLGNNLQEKHYLKAKHLKLGILANFRSKRLTYRRIVNPDQTVLIEADSL